MSLNSEMSAIDDQKTDGKPRKLYEKVHSALSETFKKIIKHKLKYAEKVKGAEEKASPKIVGQTPSDSKDD